VWLCFFFFSSRRRHTRFSRDWSSDVCSSDLVDGQEGWDGGDKFGSRTEATFQLKVDEERVIRLEVEGPLLVTSRYEKILVRPRRSEERRVGKECRSGWWPDH